MKKNLIAILTVFSLAVSALCAGDATITFVKGKVEVNRNAEWYTLDVGDVVHEGEVISTGFQSEAKLKYNGNYMTLGSLTRCCLEEMNTSGNDEKVSVALSTGALRSKVTHPDNTRVNYQVRSPVAVASVRGTDFLSFANGTTICFDGAVAVSPIRSVINATSTTDDDEAVEEEEEAEMEEDGSVDSELAMGDVGAVESSDSGAADEAPQEPAKATTPATDIDKNAPVGTVVVGKNQTTEFTTSGNPERPMDNAEKTIVSATKTVQTAAETEVISAGGSTVVPPTPVKAPETTNISVKIEFAD